MGTRQENRIGVWDNNFRGVWHFPNGTAETENGSTGNGNSGTIRGVTATSGQVGGAALMASSNGTTNGIAVPSTSLLDTDVHTISFWLKFNADSNQWGQVMDFRPPGTDRSPGIWAYAGYDCLHWRYDPGNTAGTSCAGPAGERSSFSPGQWYYITGVKNGGTFTCYVNGSQKEQNAVANPKTSGSAAVEFGHRASNASPFSLDEFRISNVVRSSDWIAT